MKKKIPFLILTILLSNITTLWAQEPEDVALDKNEFEEAYYDSLIQKGIENHDKAIRFLEICLKNQPQNAVIYHEIGKNYFFQKDYQNAETAFTKAIEIDPNNKWYYIGLYEVYYETKNYNQAILVTQKIIPFNKEYREDLLSLYMYTFQYDKALVLINELDDTIGKTEFRDRYRLEIQNQTNTNKSDKSDLVKAIEDSPLIEENYLSLIARYSDNNQEIKAREIAEKLEKNIPNSEWAQVFLFKYFVNENNGEKASKSLEIVLKGNKIDKKIKFKMFNEFLIFATKNTSYESQLNNAISYFENDKVFNVYKELGKFYYKRKNWNSAITNFEKASNEDLETNMLLLSSYEEIKNFDKLSSKASDLIDVFPNQPEYYFFAGKASNKTIKHKKAIEYLESGIDYVVENVALEIDFLLQLSEAYKGIGNVSKSNECTAKTVTLKNKKK